MENRMQTDLGNNSKKSGTIFSRHGIADSDAITIVVSASLVVVLVVLYFFVFPKDHGSTPWQGVDSFAGTATAVVAVALFVVLIHSRWRDSLENVMTVHFVNIGEHGPRIEMSIHDVTLSSMDDVRAFAQSVGQQVTGGARLPLGIYFDISKEKKTVRLDNKVSPPVNRYIVYYPVLSTIRVRGPKEDSKEAEDRQVCKFQAQKTIPLQNYIVVYPDRETLVRHDFADLSTSEDGGEIDRLAGLETGSVKAAHIKCMAGDSKHGPFPRSAIPLSVVKNSKDGDWLDWDRLKDSRDMKISGRRSNQNDGDEE